MTRVFIANRQSEARAAFRLLLLLLDMRVAGEAADWSTTLKQAPATQPDLIVVDGELLTAPDDVALSALRGACSHSVVIVLLSHLEAREQAALSMGADLFISKNAAVSGARDAQRRALAISVMLSGWQVRSAQRPAAKGSWISQSMRSSSAT